MKATDAYRKINNSPIKGIVLFYTEHLLQLTEVALGSVISKIQTGKTPPKAELKYYESSDVNWFKPSDIGYGKFLTDAKEKFSQIAVIEKKTTIYPQNTLLMIGIGGGALLVPLLTFFSLDMKKAIGCASACGIIIALFGSIGYISSGSTYFSLEDGFAGFVYLPALFGIVCTSWFTAPLGAKATHYLPVSTIKKIFAALLLVMAANMVFN